MKATSPLVLWHAIAFVYLCLSGTSGSITRKPEVIRVHNAAVATDDERCSKIGSKVLEDGGNAVDSAVASALCLGVVSPASSGIGGGAFMVIRLANGTTQAFDMREVAPMKASTNMYNGNETLKSQGPLSIAVPGQLKGLHQVWKLHGNLSWERLVRPAQVLARGFKISPYLYSEMVLMESTIVLDEGLREVFTVNGTLLQPGDICHNKKLSQTLRIISKEGANAFYNGSIGLKLINDIQKLGGIINMTDLHNYTVKMREPISSDILGMKLFGMPPPSSGGPGIPLFLNIIKQYQLPQGVRGALGTHRIIEALKNVFAVRTNLGDPDFVDVTAVVSDMLSPEFAKQLQATIYDNMTFGPAHYGGKWNPIVDHGTSHMSIVDQEGNAVAATCTINNHFGSQILSPSTGIVLNNEMDDFSMPAKLSRGNPPPAKANFIHPGKRPLSSMSPTIILKDDKLFAVVGASGGPMIIPAVAEVIVNHFIKKMDPLSAVMAPRVYHRWIPNVVFYENFTSVTGDKYEVPAYIRASLHKKGHVLESIDSGAVCQFITINETLKGNASHGRIVAVSDARKGGIPAGY